MPLKLFAASRKGEDIGFSSADPQREVLYPKLDVSSRESITALAEEVKREGLVDVLINNAGVNLDAKYGYENARTTLDVNYRGVREVGGKNLILMILIVLPCLSPSHDICHTTGRMCLIRPLNPYLFLRDLAS